MSAKSIMIICAAIILTACSEPEPTTVIVASLTSTITPTPLATSTATATATPTATSTPTATPVPWRDVIRSRGYVICGLDPSRPDFGVRTAGIASGFDVDLCRALAAALFDDSDAIALQTLDATQAAAALSIDQIDVYFGTLESGLPSLRRGPTMFFDAVGVIARTDVGISELGDLSFTTICVIENSREQALFDAAAVAGRVQYQSFFFAMGDGETMYATYNRGHCDAIVDERVRLAQRLPNFSTPHEQAFINLTLLIGPHGVFTSARDANWTEIVRSVNSAIIQAEMLGLTSFNLENALSSEDIAMRQLLGLEGDAAARLGLSSDFVVRVISHVGNYAEIYERHFGSDLPRGPNALLEDGGMISTP